MQDDVRTEAETGEQTPPGPTDPAASETAGTPMANPAAPMVEERPSLWTRIKGWFGA